MKKVLSLFVIFVIAFTCLNGCLLDETKKPDLTDASSSGTTFPVSEAETTTEETTTEETTTEETTTGATTTEKERVTESSATEEHISTTKKRVTTTAKPETTLPETQRMVIDMADVVCDEIDPDKPMIALTFDDGPSLHTPRLLNIFKKHGGKGTFFVVGNLLEENQITVKRIVKEGHEIASHSWRHSDLSTLTLEQVKTDLARTHQKIYDITGVQPKLVRPPYGAYNDTVRYGAYTCNEALITWSVDTLDWKSKNAKAVYNAVMKSASDGAIILCHDLHETTVDAMEKAIPDLIEKGYQLVTVSQLLSMRKGEVVAGGVYYKG